MPLLALHPMQHLAMFSRRMIHASSMMCSRDALSRRLALHRKLYPTVDTAPVALNDLALQPARNLPSVHSTTRYRRGNPRAQRTGAQLRRFCVPPSVDRRTPARQSPTGRPSAVGLRPATRAGSRQPQRLIGQRAYHDRLRT